MNRTKLLSFALASLLFAGCAESVGQTVDETSRVDRAGQERYPDALPVEDLMAIGSRVGGEVPRWSPDGSALTYFMEEQELRHIKLLEYELGPLEENRELYRNLSPIYFVEDITTPFLVIHGEGYFPESEAGQNFVNELQRHYKPFRYQVYENENYYVRSRENQTRMLSDMLEFLDDNLKDHRIASFAPEPGARGMP